jgi:metal-responsive CopG/Arc/MetJ family transcriptional regulator
MPMEKIAVTVDPKLLARVEALRHRTKESRSALVSRALRELLREQQHADRVRRYVEAYEESPETAVDVQLAGALAAEALATVAWDDR